MLPCSNGASTLGKTLRRPIMNTMNSLESSVASTESMRSTVSRTGGRALSSTTRSSTHHPQLRTWHPNHGIVFRTLSTTSRTPSVAATAELREDHLLHSNAEDNYVLASADLPALDKEVNPTPAVAEDESKPAARLTADELHEQALNDPEQDELPETSTSYKMPEEIFRAAKDASAGSPESFWSHSLYRSPPDAEGKRKKPVVHYCRTIHTTEKVIKDYFKGKTVIGFDIEWQPEAFKLSKARKNVSLIQLACEDRIALFHLALYPRIAETSDNNLAALVAPSLKKVMEDPKITKVGVAIKADCTRLRKYLDIHAQNIFELSHLHKLVKFSKNKDFGLINRSLVSLAKQIQEHLHLPLFKGDEVRSTDWSQKLHMAQIMYAASDSYAGFQLFHTLELKRKALDPIPPCPYPAEFNKAIRLAEGVEIPPEEDDPKVTSTDVKVIRRTRRYGKRVLAAAAEVVKDEDFSPASELPHSFFTSKSENPLSVALQKTNLGDVSPEPPNDSLQLQKAEKASMRHIRAKQGKLGDVSHLPLSPTQLSKRSIKTYYLWLDNPTLKLEDIGAMLRSPPMTARAVSTMILEAITADKLPYQKSRLREVLKIQAIYTDGNYIPEHRYFELARDSGYNELREQELATQ
ncbi:ribonuclease H-like protein [Mollisia scopiformis]|uniref:Ribonuclease H-like protein n=1 Tax=Mollisia scopiformis TaxID=149040 RepID=A0A194X5S7_MOLSC|nr:ribonuclease H-like protein [Mollisia scopiformis]KUJ15531.1 ribonuclease H-like protein [Mollisia scopiformis]